MDVVKRNIEALRGQIHIASQIGAAAPPCRSACR
jgi:chemotaxis protein histidine kinase CheA